jgi:hypothetical protein
MNFHHVKPIIIKITCILVASHQFVAGGGLRVVRPTLDEVEWAKERDTLTKSYRDNEKSHAISKIVPLFIAVKLNLGEPVAEYGAVLREFAYVYSEVKDKNEEIVRKITVLGRSPYEDRRWGQIEIIVEGEEAVSSVLVIKPSVDFTEQLTNHSKKIIGPLGLRDHMISIIFFEKGVSEVLGKLLDDEQLKSVFLE